MPKPPSHTLDVQPDPQLPVNRFKWETWLILSAFIGHHSFIQGIYNLEKISTLDLEEDTPPTFPMVAA